MKDLDFEELDKAVNSLVAQDKAKTTPHAASDLSAPMPDSNNQPLRTSNIMTPKPVLQPRAVSRSKTISVTHGNRLGQSSNTRVVDIMAPKKSNKLPSRTAPSIKPPETSVEPPTPVIDVKKAPTPIQSTPEAKENSEALAVIRDELPAQAPEAETPKVDENLLKTPTAEQWPDPLDFSEGPTTTLPKAESSESRQKTETSSPFLPDAKVEKRPLGAFTSNTTNIEPTPTTSPETPLDGSLSPAEVPEELAPAVLAAEASEPPADVPIEEPPKEAMPEPEEQPMTTQPQVEQQMRSNARAAIPRQYPIPEKSVDNTTRPVFDTKEYHPPLLEATAHGHRSSIWGRLFIVLLILVVLVVGGYFAFMYFVQSS